MKSNKSKLNKQDLYFLKKQTIVLEDFNTDGFILDIGGGGEGVIGKLKGKQVVAIDSNRDELLEAAEGPLKIVMDATRLGFLDESFNLATAFFSLMYMTASDHKGVFSEVFSVLRDKGIFRIWDIQLIQPTDTEKPGFAVPVEVVLPDGKISTGYGSYWPMENYDLDYYTKLAKDTGFKVVERDLHNNSLSLILQKTSRDN